MSHALQDLSEALIKTVDTIGHSVVRVEARRRLPATGVVWSADGHIVSANHVVQQDENIKVGLPNGEVVMARVVGRDSYTDLVVLKADAVGLVVPTWAETDELKIGHLVVAVGRPGATVKASMGIVASIWQTPVAGKTENYVQAEITMYPGFSGSPLVDANGRIHGINTSGLMRNTNLTLPISTVRRVVQSLVEHGKVRHGYLGVAAQAVRLPANVVNEINQEAGLLIIQVEADSPAEKGGLLMGDTLVSLNGSPLRQMEELHAALYGQGGVTVTLRLIRGGAWHEVSVTIGERS